MTDFNVKMHQIWFLPAGVSYSAPADPLALFKRSYF